MRQVFACLAFLAILLTSSFTSVWAESPAKNVLLLYSGRFIAPLSIQVDEAIRATFQRSPSMKVELYAETLDVARFDPERYGALLATYLREKYAGRKLDLIITSLPQAPRFLLKFRKELFPNTPIVFCLVDEVELADLTPAPNVTGVPVRIPWKETLELALGVHPDTRHVVVIAGTDGLARFYLRETHQLYQPYENRLAFTYLTDRTLSQLLKEVASLPPHTVIIYTTFAVDGAGQAYIDAEVSGLVAKAANAPVYGINSTYLGRGITGGHLVDNGAHATRAAEIGLRILAGEQPADIVVGDIPSSPTFDARQLKRWKISEKRLPAGSIVRFKDPSLWEQYRLSILILGVCLLEALLILALLVHRRRRRVAEMRLQESEGRLRLAMDATALDVWFWDIPGDRVRLSKWVGGMLAQSPTAEVTLKEFLAMVDPEDRERVDRALQQAIRTREEYEIEFRIPQQDGTVQWISSRGSCAYDQTGMPLRMTGVSHTITERKRAEEEQQLLAAVVESSHDAIISLNLDAKLTSWNPGAERLFGYSAAEAKGQSIWFLAPPESREETMRAFERISAGEAISWETVRCRKDGTRIEVSVASAPIRNAAGGIVGVTTTLHDITERKKAEEEIRKSGAKYRELYESLRDGFVLVDMDGRIKEYNDSYREMTGYTSEELLAITYQHLTPQTWHAFEQKIIEEQVLPLGYSDVYEKEYRRKDGTVFPVELRVFLLKDEMGANSGMWAIVRDVTERKRAEEQLRTSEERFRQVAENVGDFIWEVDAEGLYRYTSPSVEQILGYRPEELVGKVHFYDLFAPEVREELKAAALSAMATKQSFRAFPNPNVSKEGKVVDLETSGAPVLDADGNLIGYRGADTDVTERKRAELETDHLRRDLAHISRVTMMGELTASLAHELNQPLTAIVANAQAGERFLAQPAPSLEEVAEILADVAADAQRAGEVIRRLRSLLKKEESHFVPLDLNQVVQEVIVLTQTDAIMRNLVIRLDLDPDLPPVLGERILLHQVLLNLVLNGMEAMGHRPGEGRQLVIRTASDADAVWVEVRDDGPGIPGEALKHIFEAFFTTKSDGIGMGLAISRSIVKAHGGRIWAENNPDRGATFWFTLPSHHQGASHTNA